MLEVSRSGYYEWLGRKPSLRRQQDQALKRRLLSLHQRYPALGLDSLYHLIRSELACSRKRIHRLMNELNISSARKRAYRKIQAREIKTMLVGKEYLISPAEFERITGGDKDGNHHSQE